MILNTTIDTLFLLQEKMPEARFTEEPIPALSVMHVTIEGTRPEVECFAQAYTDKYPIQKWGTANLGDAIFVGKRLRDVVWGDPTFDPYGDPIKDGVYQLTILRRIHERS
jgi:hypothetical protein